MENEKEGQAWVEVSLLVNGELAEPVASLLSEHLSEGVVMEQVGEGVEGDAPGLSGRVKVYGYIPRDARLQERQEEIKRALWHLSQIKALPEPTFRPLKVEDWRTAWRKKYRPIPIGTRLIVVPSWMTPPDQEREPIFISPGMAFGSGTHPTTQLSMVLIEGVLNEKTDQPQAMIDVGCGSGILSIAAAKLGVPYVLGLDTDEAAVQVARTNLMENGVQDRVDIRRGSVAELRKGDFNLRKAPLVCANIIAPVLQGLFEEGLASCVEPGGDLLLSGMLAEQADDILDLLEGEGFELVSQPKEGDWVALRGQKKGGE